MSTPVEQVDELSVRRSERGARIGCHVTPPAGGATRGGRLAAAGWVAAAAWP